MTEVDIAVAAGALALGKALARAMPSAAFVAFAISYSMLDDASRTTAIEMG